MRQPARASARSTGPCARVLRREALHGAAPDVACGQKSDCIGDRRGDRDDDDAAREAEQRTGDKGQDGAGDQEEHERHVGGSEGEDADCPSGVDPGPEPRERNLEWHRPGQDDARGEQANRGDQPEPGLATASRRFRFGGEW